MQLCGTRCEFRDGLTPWLTGAGARSAEGTDIGHENGEAMAYVGVRVEPPVRLGAEVEGFKRAHCCSFGLERYVSSRVLIGIAEWRFTCSASFRK